MELYGHKNKRSKIYNVTAVLADGTTHQYNIETVGSRIAAKDVVSRLMKQDIRVNPVTDDISKANVQVLDTSTGKLHYYFALLPKRNKYDKDFEVYLLDSSKNEIKVNVVAPGAASAALQAIYSLNPTGSKKYTTKPVTPDRANAKVVNLNNNDVHYFYIKAISR